MGVGGGGVKGTAGGDFRVGGWLQGGGVGGVAEGCGEVQGGGDVGGGVEGVVGVDCEGGEGGGGGRGVWWVRVGEVGVGGWHCCCCWIGS